MKFNLKKILSNQLGVSLVELLISVGMMGGVALTVSEMMKQSAQVSSTIRTKSDESELMTFLNAKLGQPTVCAKNFAVGSAAAKSSFNSNRLLDADDSVIAQVGTTYGENQDLVISSISSTYTANSSWISLNIDFTKGRAKSGSKIISRSILIFAEVDGAGLVERCLGSSLSVEDSTWDLACVSNTSASGRDVMTTITDPADATKTLCMKKTLNINGCGYLATEFINSFTYDASTRSFTANCVSSSGTPPLCGTNFMMNYNADGTANCVAISALQSYQMFNQTNDAGVFTSGPAVVNCTGKTLSGLSNSGSQISIACGTATPTPTPTNTPTASPSPTPACVANGASSGCHPSANANTRISHAGCCSGWTLVSSTQGACSAANRVGSCSTTPTPTPTNTPTMVQAQPSMNWSAIGMSPMYPCGDMTDEAVHLATYIEETCESAYSSLISTTNKSYISSYRSTLVGYQAQYGWNCQYGFGTPFLWASTSCSGMGCSCGIPQCIAGETHTCECRYSPPTWAPPHFSSRYGCTPASAGSWVPCHCLATGNMW